MVAMLERPALVVEAEPEYGWSCPGGCGRKARPSPTDDRELVQTRRRSSVGTRRMIPTGVAEISRLFTCGGCGLAFRVATLLPGADA